MNASLPTTNFDFTESRSISRPASGYTTAPAAANESAGGFGRWLAGRVAGLMAWPRKQAVINELTRMTDRELADIGLTRGDIPLVFDRAYVLGLTGRDRQDRLAA